DGKGWRQAFALYPQSFANKLEDDWVLPGPETREQVLARCGSFLQAELSASEGDLLIIGHGASTMALLRFMLGEQQDRLENHHLWNCALSEFAVHGEKFEAKMLAYTGFLDDDEVSSNLKMRRDENIYSA
ncbi:MAG: histidine phosphatase family protein, partial [Lentisphaeria bacterium]|nr:histidine phosphatase family protein [Lentisphaeria bacterium]